MSTAAIIAAFNLAMPRERAQFFERLRAAGLIGSDTVFDATRRIPSRAQLWHKQPIRIGNQMFASQLEAASALGVHKNTVANWLKRGLAVRVAR